LRDNVMSAGVGARAYCESHALPTLEAFAWNRRACRLRRQRSSRADNLIVSDFASVAPQRIDVLRKTGYLVRFQLSSWTVKEHRRPRTDDTYGLYFQFSDAGTVNGHFSSLNTACSASTEYRLRPGPGQSRRCRSGPAGHPAA
jgi:hypothetical protein